MAQISRGLRGRAAFEQRGEQKPARFELQLRGRLQTRQSAAHQLGVRQRVGLRRQHRRRRYSWDYHIFINEFRKRPEIAGWLYTQLTDVINEWNGYWRFDRSDKATGLDELVDGMSLQDLHAPLYVIVGDKMSEEVQAGEKVSVPLWASFLTGSRAYGDELILDSELYGWDTLGRKKTYQQMRQRIPYRPWMTGALDPLAVQMPEEPGVAILSTELK